jgi:hypothetical protein
MASSTTTLTISSVKQSIAGQVSIANPLTPSIVQINVPNSLSFSQGNATPAIGFLNNLYIGQQILPPGGQETININSGRITGSETITMLQPGGATFGLSSGLLICQVALQADGADSISIFPAASNGFIPAIGSCTIPVVSGSSSLGQGGMFENVRGDANGWTVSPAACNMVVLNNDTTTSAVYDLILGGN